MNTQSFIARHLKFGNGLSIVATALSFLLIISAVAIAQGFREEIRKSLSEMSGDIQVSAEAGAELSGGTPVDLNEDWIKEAAALKGVKRISPAVYQSAIACHGDDIHGVIFKGIETADTIGGVTIPRRLSMLLSLSEGDELLCYFISDKVKVRKFPVRGIYDPVSDSADKLVVLAPIDDMRRVCSMGENEASVVEILLEDEYRKQPMLSELLFDISEMSGMVVTELQDRYAPLFSWLRLIDSNVLAILLLMSVVAGFNMISGLLIMIFRSIPVIGTLKTLGMSDSKVASVFLKVGARSTALGMLVGNAAALLFCLLQSKFRMISLDPASYFLSYVPVSVNLPLIVLADAAAFIAILLLLSLPCLGIAKIDPAKAVKVD